MSTPLTTETRVRQLTIMKHISLDGVIQHSADDDDFPCSDWTAPYRAPAGRGAALAAYREHVDLLFSTDRVAGPLKT